MDRVGQLEEALRRLIEAIDKADEAGVLSDHGEAEADLKGCPGCALDVATEDAREVLECRS